ncbi:MAG TPA: hypothetical protein DCR14_18450, partial [Acidimicrobiaceae bacterium]|nr:hypothetical protein [Acidimicrobiaceae bacterium]
SLVLSDALYEMGDFTGSAAEATAALGVATEPDEQGMLVASLYRAYLWGLDDADGALAVIDFALAVTPPGEATVQLTVAAANALSFSDRPALALERLAVLDRDVALLSESTLFAPVEQATLAQLGRTADASAEPVPDGAHALHQVVRSFSLTEHGRFDEAAAIGQDLRTDVIGLALTLDQMWAALNAGRAHLMAGRPRSALLWAGDAMIIAERAGLIAGQSLIVSVLAAAHGQLGDAAAVAAVDARAAELVHVRGFLRAERAVGRAWAAYLRGEHSLARQLLVDGAAMARSAGQVVSESFLLHELFRLGGPPTPDRLAQLAAGAQSPLVHARAALALAASANDAAELAAAGEQFAALGANLCAAEAFHLAAGAAQEAGRTATSYASRAEHLLQHCEGAVSPILAMVQSREVQGLSRREREIAALAAKGHSAKEIAQLLFVSTRTVENHLHRVYVKLGVSNRSELATYFPAS